MNHAEMLLNIQELVAIRSKAVPDSSLAIECLLCSEVHLECYTFAIRISILHLYHLTDVDE